MDKIVFAVKEYLGITETFIYQPLKTMTSFEVIVLTEKKKNLDQFPYSQVYSISDLPPWQRFRENIASQLGRFGYFKDVIRQHRPKLIHAHFGWEGIFMLPLKREFGLPLITSFYGMDVYMHPRSPFVRWQLKQLFAQGDLFLTYSDKMRKDLIALGAPAAKTRTQHGGADIDRFEHTSRQVEPGAEIQIILVGRFVEKKGIAIGIKAVARSLKKHPALRLKIIGYGSLKNKYLNLIHDLGIDKQVDLLGAMSYSEYMAELERSHFLIAPSVVARNGDAEGGINASVIEAMATGMPCITTLHSGSELVMPGQTGYMVKEDDPQDLSDKINYLVERPELITAMGRNAREHVKQEFDLARQTQRLEEIYKKCIYG